VTAFFVVLFDMVKGAYRCSSWLSIH